MSKKIIPDEEIDSSSLDFFWNEMANQSLLTAEEEVELGKLIEQNNIQASETMVLSNLRLASRIAIQMFKRAPKGVELADLVQEGNIGLITGVRKFDYRKGYKFSTYCTWWIRQSISRAITNTSRTIRLPTHIYTEISILNKAINQLSDSLGRKPTLSELSVQLGIEEEKISNLLINTAELISLDDYVLSEEYDRLVDFIPDETADTTSQGMLSVLSENIAKLLLTLRPRERQVLEFRFGLIDGQNRTLEEVGEIVGVTRERIRQIEVKAFKKIRSNSIFRETFSDNNGGQPNQQNPVKKVRLTQIQYRVISLLCQTPAKRLTDQQVADKFGITVRAVRAHATKGLNVLATYDKQHRGVKTLSTYQIRQLLTIHNQVHNIKNYFSLPTTANRRAK